MGNKPNDAAREPRLSPSIKDLAAKAKQAAVKAQSTVLKAVDKNGNGKIDAEDFGITKESMQDAAQKLKASANRIGESLNDAKTELDRRVLRPVFKEDLYWEDGRPLLKYYVYVRYSGHCDPSNQL